VSREVLDAVAAGRPVVALETSIVGQGLPAPHNLRAAFESEAAIRKEGGIPASVAVLDGKVHVGLTAGDLERVAAGAVKVSSRDLGPAIVKGEVGATTVAATMRAAAMAGIRFFATGGIGGVHRGHPEDQSADLVELGRTAGIRFGFDVEGDDQRLGGDREVDVVDVDVAQTRVDDLGPSFSLVAQLL